MTASNPKTQRLVAPETAAEPVRAAFHASVPGARDRLHSRPPASAAVAARVAHTVAKTALAGDQPSQEEHNMLFVLMLLGAVMAIGPWFVPDATLPVFTKVVLSVAGVAVIMVTGI